MRAIVGLAGDCRPAGDCHGGLLQKWRPPTKKGPE